MGIECLTIEREMLFKNEGHQYTKMSLNVQSLAALCTLLSFTLVISVLLLVEQSEYNYCKTP